MNMSTQIKADFVEEAMRIIKIAEKKGIILRLSGSIAIRIHCPKYRYIEKELGRELTDIDLVSYGKYREALERLLPDLGYSYDKIAAKIFTIEYGFLDRLIFEDPIHKRHVDVFFDKFEFCHTIPLVGRLELDYPTLALADLLLTKLQIVKINEKDVIDVITLLKEHNVGGTGKEIVDAKYIASLCAKDWGLWRTVTGNLRLIKEMLEAYNQLSNNDKKEVSNKINEILSYINREPKSMSWKLRSVIGERKKWYRVVEELSR